MKRLILAMAASGSLLLAAVPSAAIAANDGRIGSPQTQPNPSEFATTYHACLGPLRSLIAQGAFAGVGPFGEHFTGAVEPGAHYGTVGEAAFLLAMLGLTPDACATLVGP
jgi:hypothetical protein